MKSVAPEDGDQNLNNSIGHGEKVSESQISIIPNDVYKEIKYWESRLAEKEKDASQLEIQIQDLRTSQIREQ